MGVKLAIAVSTVCLAAGTASSQSLELLRSAFSGAFDWNEISATVSFSKSGEIALTNAGLNSFIWQLPPEVKQVRIAKGVTVNGAFHSKASVTIAGEDRKTSVVYGTDEQRWSQNRSIKAFTICPFLKVGSMMTISNRTLPNPRGFPDLMKRICWNNLPRVVVAPRFFFTKDVK